MRLRVLLLLALILLAGIFRAARPPHAVAPAAQPHVPSVLPAAVQTTQSAARPKPPAKPGVVRVAAIQCCSKMGKVTQNRQLLSDLVVRAAGQGAQICVLPECAVQGYMDPPRNRTWSSGEIEDEGQLAVVDAAEKVPGNSTRYFAGLSRKHRLYIALPLIETDGERFFNSLVLLDPQGEIAAHHRKHALWAPGDGAWATAGEKPAQVVATPYGKIGLMVCYDLHEMPKLLKRAGAQIVLYSVGWVGPNSENFFSDIFPRRYVVPYGYAIVAANWSAQSQDTVFDGAGRSCVIDRNGVVLAMAKTNVGSEIVLAELQIAE